MSSTRQPHRWAIAIVLLAAAVLAACQSDTNGSGRLATASPVAGISSAPATPATPAAPATSTAPAPASAPGSTGPSTPTPAGSYSGLTGQGRPVSFYVSADGASLQDISIRTVQLDCTPSAAAFDMLAIPSVSLAADGSFNIETRQDGVFSDGRAQFTYRFAGNVESNSAQDTTTGTGTFRETITYTDTAKHVCTTNDQAWSATLDPQPAQPTGLPTPGTYSGLTSQGRPLTFSVTTGPAMVQNITAATVGLLCLPGGTATFDHFTIATATIDAQNSFRVTKPQDGIFSGFHARFTVQFSGTFHGLDRNGAPRAAGSFRETITYTDTTTHTCTSNDQSWVATRSG